MWFPVYVAVLGLSGWALTAGLAALAPHAPRFDRQSQAARPGNEAPTPRTGGPAHAAGTWLPLFGGLYALLEVATVASALLRGTPLASAANAGLPTVPVIAAFCVFATLHALFLARPARRLDTGDAGAVSEHATEPQRSHAGEETPAGR